MGWVVYLWLGCSHCMSECLGLKPPLQLPAEAAPGGTGSGPGSSGPAPVGRAWIGATGPQLWTFPQKLQIPAEGLADGGSVSQIHHNLFKKFTELFSLLLHLLSCCWTFQGNMNHPVELRTIPPEFQANGHISNCYDRSE